MSLARDTYRRLLPLSLRNTVRSRIDVMGEATSAGRMLPGFLILGAARSGTSALYEYLVRHPFVGRSMVEEVDYFSFQYAKGVAWYRGHFPSFVQRAYVRRRFGEHLITGEASPYYFFHPLAPGRVGALLPDARLIVCLRNPVDRAYSHYHNARALGFEPLRTFEEAIDAEARRLDGETARIAADPTNFSRSHYSHSYLARGRYLEQLERWHEVFRPSQILILNTEQMLADSRTAHLRALEFLDLPAIPLSSYRRHGARAAPPMSPSTRARLEEYFAGGNEALFRFLGTSFAW